MPVSTDDPIFQRIQNAFENEVRQVLADLYIDDVVKGTTDRLFDKLLQKAASPKSKSRREHHSATPPAEAQYFICIICRNAYTEEENSPTACRQYHPAIKALLCLIPTAGIGMSCCHEYAARDELSPNGCRPCRHKQGGSKTAPAAGQSSESGASAASGNPRKRARAEVIVISDDDDDSVSG